METDFFSRLVVVVVFPLGDFRHEFFQMSQKKIGLQLFGAIDGNSFRLARLAVAFDEGVIDEHDDFAVEQLLVDERSALFNKISFDMAVNALRQAAFFNAQSEYYGFQIEYRRLHLYESVQFHRFGDILERFYDPVAEAAFPCCCWEQPSL